MAREMFGRIGVQVQWQGTAARDTDAECWPPVEIDWRPDCPRPTDPTQWLTPRLTRKAAPAYTSSWHVLPPWFPPIAWASCWDMSWCMRSRTCCRVCSRHSGQGVMKAHWDIPDFRAMQMHPLPFDELDVLLIHAGARRSTGGGAAHVGERVRLLSSPQDPPMDGQRWQLVEHLYHEALETPAAEPARRSCVQSARETKRTCARKWIPCSINRRRACWTVRCGGRWELAAMVRTGQSTG